MRLINFCQCLCIACAVLQAAEQTPAFNSRKMIEESIARQRQAITAMEPSLEIQRQVISKQLDQYTGKSSSHSFFLLPPPPPGAHAISAAAVDSGCDPLPQADVQSLVAEASQKEAVDPDLLRSIMQQESAFRPCAVSSKGALGLMQLMPETATQFGVSEPFDPKQNVDAGARLLRQLLNNYGGDVARALAAYNAGPARVDQSNGIPQIPETIDYVRRIMELLPALQ